MSLTITIPKEMDRYLKFLEKSRFIKNRQQAILTSLELFKKLSMHEWLPYIYKVGGFRTALVDISFLLEIFQLLSDAELFALGRKLGIRKKTENPIRKKTENPIYAEIDTRLVDNWPIVLKDLEILGWGKFELFKNEIKIEFGCMPIPFILGLFNGLFDTPFTPHYTKIGITVLVPTLKNNGKLY
jgi:hypothetical protein